MHMSIFGVSAEHRGVPVPLPVVVVKPPWKSYAALLVGEGIPHDDLAP